VERKEPSEGDCKLNGKSGQGKKQESGRQGGKSQDLNINQPGKGRSSTEGPQKYRLTWNSTLRAISLHNYSSGKQHVMSREMAVKEW
jgi:hypothetical protein